MESPFANLFLDIQNRLQTHVPEINYIDQNLGQYMLEEFRNQISFPCVLIDFSKTDFDEMLDNTQSADLSIKITLLHDVWDNTTSITPQAIKEVGLQYLEIDQKIFEALQGWNTDYCEPFVRKKAKSHNHHKTGLRVKKTTYTTQFEDNSCNSVSISKRLNVKQG